MKRAFVALIVMWCTARAVAEPRVVIATTTDAPALPSLATQVRVYAGRAVEVTTLVRAESSTVFAATASSVLEEQEAIAVVWVAQLGAEGVLVYAAGTWPGRALIELVRVPAGTPAEEMERTIALKVAALLDSLLVQHQPVETMLGLPPAPRPPPPSPPPATAVAAGRATGGWSLGLGGAIVREAGDRAWDGRFGGRVAYAEGGELAIGAWLGGHWQPASTITGPGGRVVVQEGAASVGVEGLRRAGAWTGVLGLRGTAAALHARGLAPDGGSAERIVIVPMLGVDVGIRHQFAATTGWELALVSETALIHQRFLVDGMPAADLQRVRVSLFAGLVVDL